MVSVQKVSGLAVVIPALNEKDTITPVIQSILQFAEQLILVDDGSTDGTGDIARGLGASVIRHEISEGYDAALADGINEAFKLGAKAVVTCDADGQHRAADIFAVSQSVISGEVDYCTGIRDRYNRAVEAALGIASARLFGTSDPFCGLKCYSRRIYELRGPFPKVLNIGTLPLSWVKIDKLRVKYQPILVHKRHDQPRFGPLIRSSLKLMRAFSRTALAYALGN